MSDNNITVVNETEKPYTLRDLSAKDVFLMSRIISKLGISKVSECFNANEISGIVNQETGSTTDEIANRVGVNVVLRIADVIISNLSACEQEIYSFLSALSGMSKSDIEKLPMDVFLEMIVDVIKKEEFKDFIKVVSRLLK